MLPSKINQIKVSQETGREANIGFRCNLMLSYFGMHPTKAEFFSAFGHSLCIISVPLRTVLGNTDLCYVNIKQEAHFDL